MNDDAPLPEVGPGPFVLPWSPADEPRRGRRALSLLLATLIGLGAVAVAVWVATDRNDGFTPIEQLAPPVPTTVAATTTTEPLPAVGTVNYERWDDAPIGDPWAVVAGGDPDETRIVGEMASPVWVADRAVTRISAWFTVPQDGEYRFWVAGDDQAWLALSMTGQPEQAKRIAEVLAPVAPNDFDTERGQSSRPIELKADRLYYIEAISLEVELSDHVEVAWSGPTFGRQVMTGATVQAVKDDAQRFLVARANG